MQPVTAPTRSERPGRAGLVRALVAVAVLAGAAFFALTSPVRLGLDLRGGTQIVSQICSSVVLSESNDVATITGMCSVNGGALQSFTLTVRASTNEFTLVTSGYSVGPKSATGGDILIGQGL